MDYLYFWDRELIFSYISFGFQKKAVFLEKRGYKKIFNEFFWKTIGPFYVAEHVWVSIFLLWIFHEKLERQNLLITQFSLPSKPFSSFFKKYIQTQCWYLSIWILSWTRVDKIWVNHLSYGIWFRYIQLESTWILYWKFILSWFDFMLTSY